MLNILNRAMFIFLLTCLEDASTFTGKKKKKRNVVYHLNAEETQSDGWKFLVT